MAFTLTPEREAVAQQLIKRYPVPRAACIPILHLCQQQEGWVSPATIAFVADKLGMSTSQVQGVVTFYTSFHQEPVAPNVVWVCRTLSCEIRGAKVIQEHLEKKLGCHAGQTSRDGKFTLKKAECLAACGQAPMVQINDDFYENLTLEKLDQIIADVAQKTPAPQAPAQNGAKESHG
ncbi:MAG TPA: NADH-quinone oxidoreductase subunit NuoE [Polyangiales bacterium]|nr:NADH-quinone oxidoreductase subunit NuoE [Polyangiales bacterium]